MHKLALISLSYRIRKFYISMIFGFLLLEFSKTKGCDLKLFQEYKNGMKKFCWIFIRKGES